MYRAILYVSRLIFYIPVQRFCKEVVTWRTLRHPNVLQLLGATMTGHKFAMTSKWMTNGNVNEFLERHKDADRFKLVGL